MNSAIQKLTNYLSLEAGRGYDNNSVVGGLDRMLVPWTEEALSTGVTQELVDVVVSRLSDYPRLSAKSREDTLRGLWNRLRAEYPELAPSPDATVSAAPEQAPSQLEKAIEKPKAELDATDESKVSEEPASYAKAASEKESSAVAGDEKAASENDELPAPDPEAASEKDNTPAPDLEPASLDSPLTAVPGIGPKSAKTLKKLDLETLGDLLWHLPRRYDDYSELKTINRLELGEEVTIIGIVDEISVRPVRGGKLKLVEATVSDGTGSIGVTWFNQTWIATRLNPGKAVVLSGGIEQYLGKLTMSGPEWEPLERKQVHTNRIVPVYPLTSGVTGKWLRRVINSVVRSHADRVVDPLPPSLVSEVGLVPFGTAFHQVHFPDSWEQLEAAQHRLAFNEMLFLQLGVMRQKRGWQELEIEPIQVEDEWMDRFLAGLPYQLTNAQQKALIDVRADLERPVPMNRLIQGDVGSGKTVIAMAGVGITASRGMQAAVMAPTSILAEQHYATFLELLPDSTGVPA